MNGLPATYWFAVAITALYGLASIGGGILGYVGAHSMASLVAGGIAGLLLLLCAVGVFYAPAVSLGGAIILAVLLLGRFLPKLIQKWNQLGEFASTTIGAVTVVMVIGGMLVLIAAALALAVKTGPSNPS
ncbi:MAG TPA: TMEM14 family protein [Gemmataceae bacterium]|nr:TMEM14 family protein [Gemmataceae bacterium]